MASPLRLEHYPSDAQKSSPESSPQNHPSPQNQMEHPPVVTMPRAARVRRRIPPVSGRALEILGHAIEYLADEYALASGTLPSIHVHDPQIEAMQMLMAANRSVYFDCPVIPPLHARLGSWILGLIPQNA